MEPGFADEIWCRGCEDAVAIPPAGHIEEGSDARFDGCETGDAYWEDGQEAECPRCGPGRVECDGESSAEFQPMSAKDAISVGIKRGRDDMRRDIVEALRARVGEYLAQDVELPSDQPIRWELRNLANAIESGALPGKGGE